MNLRVLLIGFFTLVNVISCSERCKINNIEVSELLGSVSHQKNIEYCELLKQALKKNKSAIREISLLEFDNAVGYDHGYVLVELILSVGEETYIEVIKPLNSTQKNLVLSYLEVGIEYGNISNIHSKNINEVFPQVYQYLNTEGYTKNK